MAELLAAPIPGLTKYHVAVATPKRVAAYAACLPRHYVDVERTGVLAADVERGLRCRRRACAQRFAEADREADA